ncbi:MAG: response regulator [Halieaceae bacterium]|jgi:two-component system, OmpR family, response regulator BaeR|nr:response regulator [Halieaceae bacterium]
MSEHILIVEDEVKIAQLLADYFEQADYTTHCLHRGDGVLDYVENHTISAILLDVMLPGRDGLSLCRDIRKQSDVPILMVTARVEEIDRLLGLELGADDYICKPFSPREVVARVGVILRRLNAGESFDTKLQLDDKRYRANFCGQTLDLTAVEYKLLRHLAQEPGRIFSRGQLIDSMYSDQRVVSDRTVDSHIKKLRQKIAQQCPGEECVHSVYGVGYKFEIE